MDQVACTECNPEPPDFWRDAPMNEEIRKNLTWQRHANIFHLTIESALAEWGQETNIRIENATYSI